MPITNKYQRLPLSSITILRDERQRREIEVSDLVESVSQRGVLQPVIVETLPDGNHKLIAGERRYAVSKYLNLPDIPVRFAKDLSDEDRQLIELEENVKRKDLPWQDECAAVLRLHEIFLSRDPAWTVDQTAEYIGYSQTSLSMMKRVAEELRDGNSRIATAAGWRAAYGTISRHDERKISDAMSDIISAVGRPTPAGPSSPDASQAGMGGAGTPQAGPGTSSPISILPADQSIHIADFIEFADAFTGRPFNFVHCDFPYGVNMQRSAQGNTKSWGGYADSPEVYWQLCAALARNLPRLLSQSAHLMFWFDMAQYCETMEFFEKQCPELDVLPIPLIWHKTDNKGILSDPNRRARHVYETAFMISRGDRKIVKSVSDTYGAPAQKEDHQSEKVEPMLSHFFQMFVDENTRMLDPTCGSGTSLRAAEKLGAAQVFGLELNPEFAEQARTRLRSFRVLRASEKK